MPFSLLIAMAQHEMDRGSRLFHHTVHGFLLDACPAGQGVAGGLTLVGVGRLSMLLAAGE